MPSIKETHPDIAKQWHPTKNIGINIDDVTAGSGRKVWWICPEICPQGCKHEWEATVNKRCGSNRGCPYCCANPTKCCIHTSIVTTHPAIAAQWHPTKNTDINKENIRSGSDKKIWWICPNKCPGGCLHEWEATVKNRCSRKSGCPYCSPNQLVTCIHTSIITTHPYIAKQWHPTKNIGINIESVSLGSDKKVWWFCPNKCPQGCVHEWVASINSRCRFKYHGCPYCVNKKTCIHVSIVITHPEIAKQWHLTKNINLTTDTVTSGSNKKVWWMCNNGHEWEATAANRCLGGTGCPTCKNKTAQKLFDYIKILFPDAIQEFRADWNKNPFTNKHLPFDIYIPSIKVIIELDGAQHFKQVSNWSAPEFTILKDIYKMRLAIQQGIHFIRIVQEDVYNQPLEWLDQHLKPELTNPEGYALFVSEDEDIYDLHMKFYEDNTLDQCLQKLQELYKENPDILEESEDEDSLCSQMHSELGQSPSEDEEEPQPKRNVIIPPK